MICNIILYGMTGISKIFHLSLALYIHIYICVCVCVCVLLFNYFEQLSTRIETACVCFLFRLIYKYFFNVWYNILLHKT